MELAITTGVGIFTLLLGGFVLSQDPAKRYIRLFGIMCVFIVLWVSANYIVNLPVKDLELTDAANKVAFLAGYATVFSGLVFTYYFPETKKVSKREVGMVALLGLVGASASLVDAVVGRAVVIEGATTFTSGDLVSLYIFCFTVVVVLIYRNLIIFRRKIKSLEWRQARLVLAAFIISSTVGLVLNLILPILLEQWHTTIFGPLAVLILVVLISYSIVRHGLFDIRLAVVRSAAYAFSLLCLSLIYYLLAYALSVTFFKGESNASVSVSPINILLALVLAFIFQPIKNFFDKITNSIFYRDGYNAESFFARLNEVMSTNTDLRNLLQRASVEIGATLKVKQVFFYVQYNHGHHVCAGSTPTKGLPAQDARTLNGHVEVAGGEIVVTALLQDDSSIKRLLMSHRIELLMPLVRKKKVIGYLCLGEQQGSGYTNRDMKVLAAVSDSLMIGIQNALSIQEVKEVNANLQQRIDTATEELRAINTQLRHLDTTKDEFLSMASHQLRTPLTSVKGYISMVMEGDVGRVTKTQKQLLGEAFTSSERMVHLINDFLNVSRIQTGKFLIDPSRVDLAEIIRQEVHMLEGAAKSRGISLIARLPKGPVSVDADEGKIRQVVMNFIDNALYYSKPDTSVMVCVETTNKEVIVEVRDQGIGVPVAEQSRLFTKFFRAENARRQRPDGTGIGLFLAKRVIDGHGGKILFSSSGGKGSMFGFRLPLANEANNTTDN